MIWCIIHEAESKLVVNPQEVLELRHMVVGLRNKTRAPTWGKLELGEHLVELLVDDPIKARRTSQDSAAFEHARITRVHQDATSGVRTYTLLFSDGITKKGVTRKEMQIISLHIGNSVLVKPKAGGDWERARIKAVHADAASQVRKYDVEIVKTKTLVRRVSVQDLRVRDRRLKMRRNGHENVTPPYGELQEEPSSPPLLPVDQAGSESVCPFGVKIDVVLRVPHGGRAPI